MDEVSNNFLSFEYRKSILNQISSWENKERKFESFKQFEVFHDRCNEYVLRYLESQFSKETIEQMPIVDSINVAKRIVNKQATIYCESPDRYFKGIEDEEIADAIEEFYSDNCIDGKLKMANSYLKLQDQSFVWAVPDQGKLKLRILLPHQVDSIPNQNDPEVADAIIISTFDRSFFFRPRDKATDGVNATIADYDDYRQNPQNYKFLVWTKFINFVMNGLGEIVSEVKPNPIGMLPLVDLAQGKETEFFVRGGRALTDFTVQFNGVLSDIYNVVKMQGWAVGYIKGPANLMPQSLTIGPSKLIRLPTDPNNPIPSEIGFASPNADIDGTLKFLETLVALFLSSRGMDARAVSMQLQANNYSSGVEKLLSMLDVFEATKEDFQTMKRGESELFEIIKRWSNYYLGTEWQMIPYEIPKDATIEVTFAKPEMVTSELDKVAAIEKKLNLGLITMTEAISIDRGISKESAELVKMEIEEEKMEETMTRMEAINGVQKENSQENNQANEEITPMVKNMQTMQETMQGDVED